MAFEYAQISGPKRRAKVLLRTRSLKMARNAHAYVRGSTVKFYELLEDGGRKLPAGPSVWICGDWLSVVELMASHEAAYLDHCRRYAWDEA